LAVAAANFQPGLRDRSNAALGIAPPPTRGHHCKHCANWLTAPADELAQIENHRKPMYTATTRNIEITVTPRFLPERSSQQKGHFFWAYTISIINHGAETVQLKTRHWKITDGNGRLQEVRGAGVVGEEPILKSGEAFEYTSGVPLQTPSGFMTGSYGMISESGQHFDVEIPAFSLDLTESARTLN
jgi:ApaG protein